MTPSDIAALLDDRPEEGIFRVHADAFRSAEIFELELAHLFEGGWVFVGFDFQAANPHDFFTAQVGRQPVIVMRDGDGTLAAFANACRHRGSLVCHVQSGNRKHHVCPYHGWAYDSAGRNVVVTGEPEGAYTAAFAREEHGLRKLPRFGNYRGFLFASLAADVPSLDDWLGDARAFIDLVADQGEEGLELVPGTVTYTYAGNWKMQIENSADAYHFAPTHISYLQLIERRRSFRGGTGPVSVYQKFQEKELMRGSFTLPHGHNLLWGTNPFWEARPLYLDRERVEARVGLVRTRWMFETRNALFFPNMQLLENASLQVRVNRPLAADKTEITTYCIAPKGESAAARRLRIRQYEEFYNPSGLATPDDTTIFEDCQAGQATSAVDWHQGYMRGMAAVTKGADEHARELGIAPLTSVASVFSMGDETVFHGPLREWRRRLMRALAAGPWRQHAAAAAQ